MSVLTEIRFENMLKASMGYQAAFYVRVTLEQGIVALAAGLLISRLGMLKKSGFTAPVSAKSLWMVWPIVVLAVLNGFSLFDGSMKIDYSRPLVNILFLLAPISTGFVEEIVCRGFVLTAMVGKYGSTKSGIYKAVILSSALFGALHLLNLLTGRGTLLQVGSQSVYAFFFGVFFSALFIRTGSLWPSIVTHALFDFMGSVGEIAVGSTFDNTMSGNASAEAALISVAICSVLFFYGLFLLRKASPAQMGTEMPVKSAIE